MRMLAGCRLVRAPWDELVATDNGVKLLLLLRDGFQYDLVGLLLLHYCSRLIKRDTVMRSMLRARMVYPCHDVRILRVS
jgi:hypothetical protein